MFAPGISVVALITGSTTSSKLANFLNFVNKQTYSKHINISVICAHNRENNVYSLVDACKKFDVLFALFAGTKQSLSNDFVEAFALDFTPTKRVVFSRLKSALSCNSLDDFINLSNVPGVSLYFQSRKDILLSRLNKITAVIPTSSVSFVPPLTNCLASINAQTFDRKAISIIVTYVHNNSKEVLKSLVNLCIKHNAAILFHGHNYPCFPPALARNVGARRVINAITAFVDADTVMHPHTFSRAVELMKNGDTVVHVTPAMMHHVGFKNPCFKNFDPNVFEENMKRGAYAPGTGACIFVPPNILEATHGYDERFIGYGATDWDFTDRLKPLGVKLVNLSKREENIRAMHQPHGFRSATNPLSSKNQTLYTKMKGKQPQRNPRSWGGIPVKEYEKG